LPTFDGFLCVLKEFKEYFKTNRTVKRFLCDSSAFVLLCYSMHSFWLMKWISRCCFQSWLRTVSTIDFYTTSDLFLIN